MSVVVIILWILFYLLVPAVVVGLCRRVPVLGKAGAILTLYFFGVIAGNCLIYPFEGASELLYPVQDLLTSLTIPLALPLILFACDFCRPGGRCRR